MNRDVIELLFAHREHLVSPISWEQHQKKHPDLPSVKELLSHLQDWRSVLVKFDLPKKRSYNKRDLITIADHYKEHMTSTRSWDQFANQLYLPKSSTYIAHFGKWSEVLNKVGVTTKKSGNYRKDEIKRILQENAKHYNSPKDWDTYAKQHSFPTYKTIRNYLTYNELTQLVKSDIRKKYSEEELIQIARRHMEYFRTQKKWNEFAKQNNLPASTTYTRKFGTWKLAKVKVYER
jgi:hypothetical protein